MKFIVIAGLLVFVLLMVLSFVTKKSLKPNERERVLIRAKHSPFDRNRACRDLETIVGFGPRPPGSEALAALRRYLKRELAACGVTFREHAFQADTPQGKRTMVNLVAMVEGTHSGVILLGNHYDTKYFADMDFVGANDGGSTTAWMLEMARALGRTRTGRSLWLTWFDGEEAFETWSKTDGLYGSRAFIEHLRETDELDQVEAMINVDMIGDCYLRILRDRKAAPWLEGIVWDTAQQLGYRNHFGRLALSIEDDHIPFREAGIPALELIDFSYGGSILEHRKNWHTERDTLDKVCAESLQAVADVIYHALPAIDGHLDQRRHP